MFRDMWNSALINAYSDWICFHWKVPFVIDEAIDLDLIHSMDIPDILNPTSGSSSSGTNLGSNSSGSSLPNGVQSSDEFNRLRKGLVDKLCGQYIHNDQFKSHQLALYSKHFSSEFTIKKNTAEANVLHSCVLKYFDDGRYTLKTVDGLDTLVHSNTKQSLKVNLGIIHALDETKDL